MKGRSLGKHLVKNTLAMFGSNPCSGSRNRFLYEFHVGSNIKLWSLLWRVKRCFIRKSFDADLKILIHIVKKSWCIPVFKLFERCSLITATVCAYRVNNITSRFFEYASQNYRLHIKIFHIYIKIIEYTSNIHQKIFE